MQQNARRYCEQDSADECEDKLSRLHQAADQTRVNKQSLLQANNYH